MDGRSEMIDVTDVDVILGRRPVLAGVSLCLPRGTITAVLGPNGAGKTTLLRTMNRTVDVARGGITIGGRKVSEMSRREIAHMVAVVAQETETKFPIRVSEFVLAGRFANGNTFGWESADDIAAADSALSECDLADHASRNMNQLSGGERQRAVLARALAAGTPVILLDEPTANLDIAHQAMMFRLIKERCKEMGTTAAVITHDLNAAAEFADRVVLLKKGTVFAAGEASEVLNAAYIREVFAMEVLIDQHPISKRTRVTNMY